MGNQASSLSDEPFYGGRDLHHFDHSFKGELHTTNGNFLTSVLGEVIASNGPIQLICKGSSCEILDDAGLTARKSIEISYTQINEITWDHANSEVKLGINRDGEQNFVIFKMQNTIELEQELKLRFNSLAVLNRGIKVPFPAYIGMFAGAIKPKPFQRKRPNLSTLGIGKLPPLHDMRGDALILHRGSYKPCDQGASRRMALAMQHIHRGYNSFKIIDVRGPPAIVDRFVSLKSLLFILDGMIAYRPNGESSDIGSVAYHFEDMHDFSAIDNDKHRDGGSGIEIECLNGERIFFGVMFVRDVKHSLEYFWNKHQIRSGRQVKLGSTHGRPLVTVTTLTGETSPPERPIGSFEVVDQDGCVVRTGQRVIPRKVSIMEAIVNPKTEIATVPPEITDVKSYWHKVVVHQGWLLKKGGVSFREKKWIKRYFVLYSTCQGHFLIYYSDFTECPLYAKFCNGQRNVVDLAKTTFIRPGSMDASVNDMPAYCFDIVTTEREWTVCAETQENLQKWLRLITRAVDEDVAILPDEELKFKVKPKVDPLGVLPVSDYSTSLNVSANGISVCTPDLNNPNGFDREQYFWAYTDFYKWSLLAQNGKMALLLNVFSDSSFSRRNEYIFRNPDSGRLATAIEYFIEKFMTVNHIRLELRPGAFDERTDIEGERQDTECHRTGMHQMATSEWQSDGNETSVNLLDMDTALNPPKSDRYTNQVASPAPVNFTRLDPFGSSYVFENSSESAAPPLSSAQTTLHEHWILHAIKSSGGPLYDDGILQIATKIEVRGSQGRMSLFYRNQSSALLQNFELAVLSLGGFIRFEIEAVPSIVRAHAEEQTVMMFELMKPHTTMPTLNIGYVGPVGIRRVSLDLPVVTITFNEPLQLSAADFTQRWQLLNDPSRQMQEVFSPSRDVVPTSILMHVTASLKFARIVGMSDESEYVVNGASMIRTGAPGPNGEKISVGCLLKIEMNIQAKKVRLTVRTVHPAATSALFICAKTVLV